MIIDFLPGLTGILDLAYAVDGTDSVSDEDLKKMQKFIKSSIQSFTISNSTSHVSLVEYGRKAKIILPFAKGTSQEIVKRAINRLSKSGGNVPLRNILQFAASDVFAEKRGSRPKASKTLVLLTVGEKSDSLPALNMTAKELSSSGVKLIIVAVGPRINGDELRTIVSDPDEFIHIDTVEKLPEVIGAVEKANGKHLGWYILLSV